MGGWAKVGGQSEGWLGPAIDRHFRWVGVQLSGEGTGGLVGWMGACGVDGGGS